MRKLNISVEEISVVEIQRVIGEMKGNKTAAVNDTPEELLEANIEATTIILHNLIYLNTIRIEKWNYYETSEKGR